MFGEMRNVVGPRIREARYLGGRNVAQLNLAAKHQTLGVDLERTALSKIENGKRPVNDLEIVVFCDALPNDPRGFPLEAPTGHREYGLTITPLSGPTLDIVSSKKGSSI